MTYQLYTIPSTAGMAPHIIFKEADIPHELRFIDKAAGELASPAYMALNPNKRAPTLVADGQVIFEAAAICQYLCERHPEAGLLPPIGTAARAEALQWLTWATNTLQPDILIYYYPERRLPPGADQALIDAAKAHIVNVLMDNFAIVDAHLADRQWLAGDAYGVADIYLFMVARWTRNMARKARDLPHLGPYMARIFERPAVQAAFAAEGLTAPYY